MGIKSLFEKIDCEGEKGKCTDPAFPAPAEIEMYMDDLLDADTSTNPPNINASLIWDGSNWVPSESAQVKVLNDLDDVTATPTETYESLIWDGEKWVAGRKIFFTVKEVTSPHTLSKADSDTWLVFDDASHAVIYVPDGLTKGFACMAANVGGGFVSFEFIENDSVRGAKTVTEVTSMFSMTKLTNTVWQSSERGEGGPPWVEPTP